MKKITLEKITEQMKDDSLIQKLNSGEVLTLKDLFTLQNYVSRKIEEFINP